MKSYKKYLIEKFGYEPEPLSNEIEIELFSVPYTFKDNQIFVANTKIADVVPNQSVTFINDEIKNELEGYFEIVDWDDSKEHEDFFESTVRVNDIKIDDDTSIDSYKVFWHKIEITEFLSRENSEIVEDKIHKEMNDKY